MWRRLHSHERVRYGRGHFKVPGWLPFLCAIRLKWFFRLTKKRFSKAGFHALPYRYGGACTHVAEHFNDKALLIKTGRVSPVLRTLKEVSHFLRCLDLSIIEIVGSAYRSYEGFCYLQVDRQSGLSIMKNNVHNIIFCFSTLSDPSFAADHVHLSRDVFSPPWIEIEPNGRSFEGPALW